MMVVFSCREQNASSESAGPRKRKGKYPARWLTDLLRAYWLLPGAAVCFPVGNVLVSASVLPAALWFSGGVQSVAAALSPPMYPQEAAERKDCSMIRAALIGWPPLRLPLPVCVSRRTRTRAVAHPSELLPQPAHQHGELREVQVRKRIGAEP